MTESSVREFKELVASLKAENEQMRSKMKEERKRFEDEKKALERKRKEVLEFDLMAATGID